jgi:hypothetical protein
MRRTTPFLRPARNAGAPARRRRLAAATIAFGLILAPSTLIAGAAFAVEPPVFSQEEYTGSVGATITIDGTGVNGATVSVLELDATCADIVVADSHWSCPADLNGFTPGDYTLTAEQRLGEEVAQDTATLVVTQEPNPGTPPPPGFGESDLDLNEGDGLSLNGTGETDAIVNLAIGESPLCGDIAVVNGAWSCTTTPFPYGPGTYVVTATQTKGGLTSEPATVTVTVSELTGRDVLDCRFSPGALTVTSASPNTRVSLYRVDPVGESQGYTAKNLGSCSGVAGSDNPGAFRDVALGTCSNFDGGEGEGGSEGEGGTPTQPHLAGNPTTGCIVSNLTPGMWNLYYSTPEGESEGETNWDWFFVVPEAPSSVAATQTSPGTALFSGRGTSGNTVTVINGAGTPICTTTIVAGTWSCSVALGAGTAEYRVVEIDAASGARSPLSTAVTLTTTAPAIAPLPTPTPTPSATPKPPFTWNLVITGVNGPLRPGQTVGLSSSGIPAGSTVDAELHSTPRHLGTTTVKPDGTFTFTVRIPLDTEPGEHRIVVTLTAPGEEPSVVESPVAIELEPEAESRAGETVEKDDPRLAGLFGEPVNRDDPAAPTALTGSLPTLLDVLTSPAALGVAAGLALMILLLVAIPAEVLNSTIESNTSRFGRFFARIESWINRGTEWLMTTTRTPAIAAALLILLTSIIFGFVDPNFGFDIASARLVLSLGIALFIVTYVASRLTGVIVGRAWSLEHSIGLQPAALLFAVLGVVVARLLDFSPGFLIGLVIGLELSHRADELQRVRALVIEFGLIVGFGILAWLGYSLAVALQVGSEPDFWSALLQDTLVAVTSEGLTAVVIAMVPLGFLDGKKIFDRSKRLWVAMFLVSATAFSLLVLPSALAGQEVGDIVVWISVLVAFAALSFGVTLWLRITGKRNEASQEPSKAHDSVA